jgi:hypothetical protein
MCPTYSFCAVSFKFPCSSTFQWQILASRIRFWPEQMMPGLFLKEIATKAGIEHPAQKLHVWTVGDRNPTQKGLARKP